MTKDKAIKEIYDYSEQRVDTARVHSIINKIYGDFENEETCDGCIYQPKENENYPIECGTCSRFYTDRFERKINV